MINHRMRPRRSSRSVRSRPDGKALTLTDEHALLLGQVSAHADDVLAVATEDRWPGQELRALLGYLRAEVLRQLGDEDRLLLPGRPGPPGFVRLRREHVRLRHCAEALARAARGESGWTAARVATTSRDLLNMLERHLAAEEAVLRTAYARGPVPATAVLTSRPHERYPLTEDGVIDVDALPADQAVDATVRRLLRLSIGEGAEVRSSNDLRAVWRRMDRLDPGGYGFAYLDEGPRRWVMRVTRHRTT